MKKAINFIDLQHGKHFSYHDKTCGEFSLKNKKFPIGARLNFNDIITHNFKLEKPLSPQELLVTAELKMYDEIGLDASKIHKISYETKKASVGDLKLVESFAIDTLAIEEKYQKNFSKVKHIDFIAIPFLVFETLYKNEIINKQNDLFITIAEEESFSTFYKEGEYVTSKKNLSLKDMVKELENLNILTDIDKLKEILLKKGLNKENYELHEYDLYDYIQKTFDSFFSKTHNIALHNRNVYGFTQVERIFFSLDNQMVPYLEETASTYFPDVIYKPLDFLATEGILALDAISASYIQDKLEEGEQRHNFTIFDKKAPFYKSEIGKFALSSVASLMILSSYPLYQQYQITSIEEENIILKEQLSTLSRATSKLKKREQKIEKEIKIEKKQQTKISTDFQKLQNIANDLLALKSKDSKYTPMFLTINSLLKKYKLSIENIKQVDKGAMDFEIYSIENKRDTIAKFMSALLSKGYTSVTSNEIKLTSDVYKSIITVKR